MAVVESIEEFKIHSDELVQFVCIHGEPGIRTSSPSILAPLSPKDYIYEVLHNPPRNISIYNKLDYLKDPPFK